MTPHRIAVVADSGVGLPRDLLEAHRLHVVPFRVIWDGEVYLDGRDITPEAFYRRLRSASTRPTTSTPSLGDFSDTYRRLAQDYAGIVSIHSPESLSATISVARQAAQEVDRAPIRIVDSGSGASAGGLVALAAARAAQQGADLAQVVAVAQATARRVGLLFALKTLEHLQRGGRIGQAASLLGTRLRIQPVLTLEAAQVRPLAITRSRAQAKERMIEHLERLAGRGPVQVAVCHADAAAEARAFQQEVSARLTVSESFLVEFSPALGAHAGPDAIGLAYCLQELRA